MERLHCRSVRERVIGEGQCVRGQTRHGSKRGGSLALGLENSTCFGVARVFGPRQPDFMNGYAVPDVRLEPRNMVGMTVRRDHDVDLGLTIVRDVGGDLLRNISDLSRSWSGGVNPAVDQNLAIAVW